MCHGAARPALRRDRQTDGQTGHKGRSASGSRTPRAAAAARTRSGEDKGGNCKGPPADRVCLITPTFTFPTEDAPIRPRNWVLQRQLGAKAAYFKKIIRKPDICPLGRWNARGIIQKDTAADRLTRARHAIPPQRDPKRCRTKRSFCFSNTCMHL